MVVEVSCRRYWPSPTLRAVARTPVPAALIAAATDTTSVGCRVTSVLFVPWVIVIVEPGTGTSSWSLPTTDDAVKAGAATDVTSKVTVPATAPATLVACTEVLDDVALAAVQVASLARFCAAVRTACSRVFTDCSELTC